MNRKDIYIGLAILALLAGVIYFTRRPSVPALDSTPIADSETEERLIEEKLENSFNIKIPDDLDRASLRDVSGGTSSAIATRKFESGNFEHTILADLPTPKAGTFYEGWLTNQDGTLFSTGRLRVAKGGYLLEFSSQTDYTDYSQVIVSLEKVADSTPEKRILEGSF